MNLKIVKNLLINIDGELLDSALPSAILETLQEHEFSKFFEFLGDYDTFFNFDAEGIFKTNSRECIEQAFYAAQEGV